MLHNNNFICEYISLKTERPYVFAESARCFCLILNIFSFSRQIFIKAPVSNFTEIRPVGPVLIQTDKRANVAKLIGASCD